MFKLIKNLWKQNNQEILPKEEKQPIKDKKRESYDVLAGMIGLEDDPKKYEKLELYKAKLEDVYKQQVDKLINKDSMAYDSASGCTNDLDCFKFVFSNNYENLLNTYSVIPFAELSLLAQIPLIYNACDTYAKEMTRTGYEFVAINPTDEDEKIIQLLKDEFSLYKIDDIRYKMIIKSLQLGGAMLYPKYKGEELILKDELNIPAIKPDTLKVFEVIEPTWCFPTNANYAYPLEPDFYSPTMYNLMGKDIHPSRLHKMVYNDVPDLVRPMYMHYGISLTQKIINAVSDYVYIKDIIIEIIKRYNLMILKVNMAEYKNNSSLLTLKVKVFNKFRSVFGTYIVDKNNEELDQLTIQLAGLNDLWGRFIEVMCMQIQIPVTKWTGISPSGFSSNDDTGHQNWYDLIYGLCVHMAKPTDDFIIRRILLNKGIDTQNYSVKYNKLEETNKLQDAQIRQIDNAIDTNLVTTGIIESSDVAKTLQQDKEGKYNGIDIIDENKKINNDIEKMNNEETE